MPTVSPQPDSSAPSTPAASGPATPGGASADPAMSGPAASSLAFSGLSAFPLTPLRDDRLDEDAFAGLIERVVSAGVDSIGVLGSTGSYAYLTGPERARVLQLAVSLAGDVPVIAGIGALRTSHVLDHLATAEDARASGVLLAPMTYQALSDEEVFELFRTVSMHARIPIVLYDNPATTHVTFSDQLYARIAALPAVASIKIPALPADPAARRARMDAIRAVVPDDVTIGISGDASAAAGLAAGCDGWYSVIAGTMPDLALPIVRAAQAGRHDEAAELSARLEPLWQLFAACGSLRVIAAAAEHRGLVGPDCLPLPVRGLDAQARQQLARFIDRIR